MGRASSFATIFYKCGWLCRIEAAAVFFSVIATLGAFGGAGALAGGPIKIGLLLTYVGPTSIFARYEDKGARLLIDQTNKNGGIDGRQIELVNYDTEGKPDRAGTLYRRLVREDNVAAVIGPDSIFVLLGMSDIPSEVKAISISSAGLYELVAPQKRRYVVSAQVATTFAGTLVLGYVKDKFHAKRLGMITTSDVIGQTIASTVGKMAAAFGMELVDVASQPASDRDLLPSLRKLANLQPNIDALYVFGSGPFANIAMNQSELAGINVPIAYNGGNVLPELVKDLSPDTAKRTFLAVARSTVWSTLPAIERNDAVVTNFLSDYHTKFGEEPTLPSAIGYDMALPIVDALKNVGTDREKLTEYIHDKQAISGAQGIIFKRTWANGYGSNPEDLAVASVSDGQFVFRGFLKDSLKNVGFTKEDMLKKMQELQLIAE
jgi:branched-chain amino acid transport system substrate-binding protein